MERYLKVEPRPPKPEMPHSRQQLGAPGLERTRLVTKALEKLINREKGKKATPSYESLRKQRVQVFDKLGLSDQDRLCDMS